MLDGWILPIDGARCIGKGLRPTGLSRLFFAPNTPALVPPLPPLSAHLPAGAEGPPVPVHAHRCQPVLLVEVSAEAVQDPVLEISLQPAVVNLPHEGLKHQDGMARDQLVFFNDQHGLEYKGRTANNQLISLVERKA